MPLKQRQYNYTDDRLQTLCALDKIKKIKVFQCNQNYENMNFSNLCDR